MANKVYIFDSHPVQYKAPVYQEMNKLDPGLFEVIYASDASVRSGNIDKDFGIEVKWDTPLLSGYEFRVLHNERGNPMSGPATLTGRGVFKLLKAERPKAILLTQARYHFDHAAYLSALVLGIPILIRQETQDEMYAGNRTKFKSIFRYLAYRLMYRGVKQAFCFGELNRRHLLKHGFKPEQLTTAHFSVANPLKQLNHEERGQIRIKVRAELGISTEKVVVAFFGKLIPKKNPDLLFQALDNLTSNDRSKLHFLFVGAGELEAELRGLAQNALNKWGIGTTFAGFVNQQKLPSHYLASDIVVLPSRRMGEAWGLVINEALNAGCAVIMSDAVGCQYEFGNWERAKVIPVGDPVALSKAITELTQLPRSLNWADKLMENYSTEAAAQAIASRLRQFIRDC